MREIQDDSASLGIYGATISRGFYALWPEEDSATPLCNWSHIPQCWRVSFSVFENREFSPCSGIGSQATVGSIGKTQDDMHQYCTIYKMRNFPFSIGLSETKELEILIEIALCLSACFIDVFCS